MEQVNLISVIISGLALIFASLIPSLFNYRIEKSKLLLNNSNSNDITKTKKRKFRRLNYWLIIVMILVSVFSFLLGNNFKITNDEKNNWIGDWIQEEQWINDISEGTLTFWIENEHIKGVAYNKKMQLIILNGQVDENGNLVGIWNNIEIKKSGEFNFHLNKDENKFSGYYISEGKKREWNGYKFLESEFTHILSTNIITLRNKGLTGIEFNEMELGNKKYDLETRIDFLIKNDKLKVIKSENQCYKVIVKSKQILKMGYISKKLSGYDIIAKIDAK